MKRKWMIEGKIADDGGHDSQDNDQHNYGNDNEFPAEEPSVDKPQKRTTPPPPPPPKASFWFPEKPQGCFSPRAGDWVRSLAASSFPPRFLRAESHPMITPLARLAFLSGCVFFCSPPSPLSLPTVLSNRHPLYMHLPHGIQRQENPLPKGS